MYKEQWKQIQDQAICDYARIIRSFHDPAYLQGALCDSLITPFRTKIEPILQAILLEVGKINVDTLDQEDIRMESLIRSIVSTVQEIEKELAGPMALSALKANHSYQRFIAKNSLVSDDTLGSDGKEEAKEEKQKKKKDTYFLSRHWKTWLLLEPHLEEIHEKFKLEEKTRSLGGLNYNRLANLFNPEDNDFLKQIEQLGEADVQDEISGLYLARMHYMLTRTGIGETNKRLEPLLVLFKERRKASFDTAASQEAFKIEIMKLALHTVLHPDRKIIWIGTGRSVLDAARRFPGQGLYLNCDDAKWSWELNRKYLEYALEQGFTFKLLEQLSEEAIEAIQSDNVTDFIMLLLKKMIPYLDPKRPKSPEDKVHIEALNTLYPREKVHADDTDLPPMTNQYDGGTEPTATMQEILALKELGCTVQIDDQNTVCFLSRRQMHRSFSESALDTDHFQIAILTSQEAPARLDQATPVYPETNPLAAIPSSISLREKSQYALDWMPILKSLTTANLSKSEKKGLYLLLLDIIEARLILLSQLLTKHSESDINIQRLIQEGTAFQQDLKKLIHIPDECVDLTMLSIGSKKLFSWFKETNTMPVDLTRADKSASSHKPPPPGN